MKALLIAALAVMLGAGAASAADLLPEKAAPAPVVAPVATDWTGFFIGAHVGYAQTNRNGCYNSQHSGTPTVDCSTNYDYLFNYNQTGGLVGVQAGYNFQLSDAFLLGFQVDASWANITGSHTEGFVTNGTAKYDFLGTATAKLGLVTGPALFYVDGGYAYAHVNYSDNTGVSFTSNPSGFMAGLGVSYLVGDNLFVDLNYNHIWFQDLNVTTSYTYGSGGTTAIHTASGADVFKIGLDYKLGN